MNRNSIAAVAAGAFLAASTGRLPAGAIPVPNGSFESPVTPYVSVTLDAWEKSPKPDWYVEEGGFLWSFNIGLFKNTPANSPDRIDNCDGNQAAWLFVVPEIELFQDYNSTPTHAFDAKFEPGKSYQLTVGVIGSGGGMQSGVTLQCGLYYRDAGSKKVLVASTQITNSTDVFTNNTHLIDFSTRTAMVQPTDVWAGKQIGIQIASSIASTNLEGGYWDLDNVRLESIEEPSLAAPVFSSGQFQFSIKSEAGLAVEILTATDPGLPLSEWVSAGTVTNASGITVFTNAAPVAPVYYRARRASL